MTGKATARTNLRPEAPSLPDGDPSPPLRRDDPPCACQALLYRMLLWSGRHAK